ncbi:MAG: asparagine synthase (glutamine-hydrolyzing) [Candidatus Electrothrix sp. AX2]|nr:asparagine synthase (glutamine-hydrolyzing) [Candidatus Electrothrix gigas]
MCGIAGICRQTGISPADVEQVKQMNTLQKHRGPDAEGVFSDSCVVLGHRRLAIIDLSNDGKQPFASDDGRYQLIFNGEIYNYLELREDLSRHGWRFRTKTDTEVLLKAYQHYGEDCLQRFNGMFAFAIYDVLQKHLFLARDRMGIKPLYYTILDSALYFASEIKALCSIPALSKAVNYQAFFDYLVFNRTDIYDETFFCDIKRIPKGCHALFDQEGLHIQQWWHPETFLTEITGEPDREKIYRDIEELFISSVRLRMRSDVPVGSCLSGGLDSSVMIGALFQHFNPKPNYPTFTASFPGHPIDETAYIDSLNHQYTFQNIRTYPNADKAYKSLKDFLYANDEPTTNSSFFSQYEVMQLAKKNGVTVLLDGQGGDENFAGYQYFHGFHLYGLLRQKKGIRLTSELAKSILRKQHVSVYQTLLFQLLPDMLRKKALLKALPYIEEDFFREYIEHSKIYNDFFNVSGLNQSLVRHFQYKLEHLLRMEDRNSMAFSLEARVPYLDYRLVEYVLGLPESLKIQDGETKYLQKKALGKYTISEILDRTDKIGFGTPGDEWMLTDKWQRLTQKNYADLAETFPDIFKQNASLPNKGFDRWKINQLCVWKNIFQVTS